MTNQPLGKLDPDKLKAERTEVDFGTDEETGHDHVGRNKGRPPADTDDPVAQPTSGAIPPAR
jgi:hypothetical protein